MWIISSLISWILLGKIYLWWLDKNNNKHIETIAKWLINLGVDILNYINHLQWLHKDL
jgi:hypothetical protein